MFDYWVLEFIWLLYLVIGDFNIGGNIDDREITSRIICRAFIIIGLIILTSFVFYPRFPDYKARLQV